MYIPEGQLEVFTDSAVLDPGIVVMMRPVTSTTTKWLGFVP
jgi:hypothetical protein